MGSPEEGGLPYLTEPRASLLVQGRPTVREYDSSRRASLAFHYEKTATCFCLRPRKELSPYPQSLYEPRSLRRLSVAARPSDPEDKALSPKPNADRRLLLHAPDPARRPWHILYSFRLWIWPCAMCGIAFAGWLFREEYDWISDNQQPFEIAPALFIVLAPLLSIYRLYLAHLTWSSARNAWGALMDSSRAATQLFLNNVHCPIHAQAMVASLVCYHHLGRKVLRGDESIKDRKVVKLITSNYSYFQNDDELQGDLEDALSTAGWLGTSMISMLVRIASRLQERNQISRAHTVQQHIFEVQRHYDTASLHLRKNAAPLDAFALPANLLLYATLALELIRTGEGHGEVVIRLSVLFGVVFVLTLLDSFTRWMQNPFKMSRNPSLPLEFFCEVTSFEAECALTDYLRRLERQALREMQLNLMAMESDLFGAGRARPDTPRPGDDDQTEIETVAPDEDHEGGEDEVPPAQPSSE